MYCPSLVPFSVDTNQINDDFVLVIDSGFNSTWIVPMIYQQIHWPAVKKLPIGGNLLNGLLREMILFRHYDISEDPILINTIKNLLVLYHCQIINKIYNINRI